MRANTLTCLPSGQGQQTVTSLRAASLSAFLVLLRLLCCFAIGCLPPSVAVLQRADVGTALRRPPRLRHLGIMTEQSRTPLLRSPERRAFTLLATIAAAFLFLKSPIALAEEAPILEARVSKILDGDTFTLKGESRRIRVWGLDAPEWNHHGGSAATATLRRLISGKRLRCAVLDIDRYGRLVAQCQLPDGRDIAAAMIQSGAAAEYCRYSRGYYGTY